MITPAQYWISTGCMLLCVNFSTIAKTFEPDSVWKEERSEGYLER